MQEYWVSFPSLGGSGLEKSTNFEQQPSLCSCGHLCVYIYIRALVTFLPLCAVYMYLQIQATFGICNICVKYTDDVGDSVNIDSQGIYTLIDTTLVVFGLVIPWVSELVPNHESAHDLWTDLLTFGYKPSHSSLITWLLTRMYMNCSVDCTTMILILSYGWCTVCTVMNNVHNQE